MAENLNLKTVDTVDTRPFKRLVMTIGELPTSFIESMTYYELLAWFVNYLETVVIPTVNNNAEATKELQDLFIELKNFVDNYFDNLDVQEEINNKLDEMVEEGTLQEIIATYLNANALWCTDTNASVSALTNLIEGSYVKTLGYKRLGDGVYNLYKVRQKESGDVADGYELINITSDNTIIAERVQRGNELVIALESTDVLQDYLSLPDRKTIVLKSDMSITSSLYLNSNTTIDLNTHTITYSGSYAGSGAISMFTYGSTDTFTGYNGHRNITIMNGKLVGGCICMMHSTNVNITNVEFSQPNTRHNIQIAGSKDITIDNCIFNGTRIIDDNMGNNEVINIDPCIYGSQPYVPEESVMYDGTPNNKIVIKNNTFNTPSLEDYQYSNSIGCHNSTSAHTVVCKNIVIEDNNLGSPVAQAINLCDFDGVIIKDNTSKTDDTNYTFAPFIRNNGWCENVKIVNNTVEGYSSLTFQPNNNNINLYYMKDIEVRNNTYRSERNYKTDQSLRPAIWFRNASNVVIDSNSVECDYYAINIGSSYVDGTAIVDTASHDFVITNNCCVSKHGGMVLLQYYVYNLSFKNNSFDFNIDNATVCFKDDRSDKTVDNNIAVVGNTAPYWSNFIPTTLFSEKTYDNGHVIPVATINSGSGTHTTSVDLTKAKALYAICGGASEDLITSRLTPYIASQHHIKINTKWGIPIVSSDGSSVLPCIIKTETATSVSVTSSVNVRVLYVEV